MDKYALVLDIVEHPEKYSSDELSEILTDPEVREIYILLCQTDSAIKTNNDIDVEKEWKRYSVVRKLTPRRNFFRFGSRAASIAIIIGSSLAVVAGIAVTINVINATADRESNIETVASIKTTDGSLSNDTIRIVESQPEEDLTPVLFEDISLETIMDRIAGIYHVEVKFKNDETAKLHLYYKLDPSLPIDEIVSQLNTFEQINIRLNGNTLIID